jgi:Tfp pilus assembly protein PilO
MKELGNKIITNLHVIIVLYALYGLYVSYDEHSIQMEAFQQQIPPMQEEIERVKKKLKEIDEFKKESEASKVRVEQVAKNIESVQRQLPPETNEGQILNFFNGEAKLLNIKDVSISAGSENSSQLTIGKEFKLKADGTYLQFTVFFERIGKADRIYNVKDLKLTVGKGIQKGRFPIITMESTVEAYRFNPSFKVDRGFEKGTPASGQNSGSSAAPTRPPRPSGRNRGGDE